MAAAETISEAVRQEKAAKAAKMADTSKGQALLLGEKSAAIMTKELNDKRHSEAAARAEAVRQEKAAKAAKMADTSKGAPILQGTAAALAKQQIDKRHSEAEARAEAAKQAIAEKGAKMSIRKAEQIKQQYVETLEEKKAAVARRHAEPKRVLKILSKLSLRRGPRCQ